MVNDRIKRRKLRISSKIFGTESRPRVSVYRSNRYIYAQAIDDVNKVTVGSSSSVVIKSSKVKVEDSTKSGVAKEVGKKLASVLKKKGIDKTVFDRNKYAYSGRVKALADGLREGGIKV